MYDGIPIIGVAGGIGSGKSHVARLFGELGCLVIDSDAQATLAYTLPEVREAIRQWWGDAVLLSDGRVDRGAIAAWVFGRREEKSRLERLIHPVIKRLRDEAMRAAAASTRPPAAFVWDAPLLFEAGLADACDAVVFVDTPRAERLRRVMTTRGWDEAELTRRENSQLPLDTKRALSHHVVGNVAADEPPAIAQPPGTPSEPSEPADASSGARIAADDVPAGRVAAGDADLRQQVERVLSRILLQCCGTAR